MHNLWPNPVYVSDWAAITPTRTDKLAWIFYNETVTPFLH